MDALKNAYKQLDEAADKAMGLIYGSTAIALKRYYGYGDIRISRMLAALIRAYSEKHTTEKRSMIQILDEETGVELQVEEGKSYKEYPYLCCEKYEKVIENKPISRAKQIYMAQRQVKWVYSLVLASVLVAMHRSYGFSCDRIVKLLERIQAIEAEYDHNPELIAKKCEEETGVKYDLLGQSTIFIYPVYPMCKKCDKINIKVCPSCEIRLTYEKQRGISLYDD